VKPLFQLCRVEHLEATVEYYRDLGLRPLAWPDDETVLNPVRRRTTAPTLAVAS
jgi:hypothetical protein